MKNGNGLISMLKNEAKAMPPAKAMMTYVIAPIYVVLTAVILVVFCVCIQSESFFVMMIGLGALGLFVLVSIAMLVSSPFVRKAAVRQEIARYNLDAEVSAGKVWAAQYDGNVVFFDENGLSYQGIRCEYNSIENPLSAHVLTHNAGGRVNIAIAFVSEKLPEKLPDEAIIIELNAYVRAMIDCLNITIANRAVYDLILYKREKAFNRIMNWGSISERYAQKHAK